MDSTKWGSKALYDKSIESSILLVNRLFHATIFWIRQSSNYLLNAYIKYSKLFRKDLK